MKMSTIVAGVIVLGGVIVGGSILTGINNNDTENVTGNIENVQENKPKEVKPDAPVKRLENKNIETQKEFTNENLKEVKLNKITEQTIDIEKKENKRVKVTEPTESVEVKEKIKPSEDNNGEEKGCYYCKHSTDIDTYKMGSEFVYDNFKNLTDDEIRDKVNELPSSMCDVHKQNVKDGVEHTLSLLHNSEEQSVTDGGEHK